MNILVHYYRLGHYIGGAEVIALNQCAELLKRNYNVTILTANVGQRSKIFKEFLNNNRNVKLVELPLKPINKTGDTWIDIDIEATQFGRYAIEHFYKNNTNNYNIVVIHNKTEALFVPDKYKTVIHLHGSPSKFENLMEIALYNASGLLAVSESVKNNWTTNIKSLSKEITVIHNGIDDSIFYNKHFYRDIDVLFVGRLYPHKGILELLEAYNNSYFNFYVVGEGPLESEVQKYSKVMYYKNVTTKQLVDFYNRTKIFACPSSSKEGVLTTMLEAAMCGCAIITTNCAGMVDFAKDKQNSILVDPKNTKALTKAILQLLKNEELCKNLALNAEKDAIDNWNIHKQTNQLLNFYKSII